MRLMLPKCPHCGKQVNWFRAWALKTQGEYRCGKCGECSNVSLDKALYPLAAVAAIAAEIKRRNSMSSHRTSSRARFVVSKRARPFRKFM